MLFISAGLRAQSVSEKKWSLDFGGSVGVMVPFDEDKDSRGQMGSNAITSLQLNYRNLFARFQLGQTTVDFKYLNHFETINTKITAKSNSTNVGFLFGYQRQFGRFEPYMMLGAGVSFVDVPMAQYDKDDNSVNFTTKAGTYLQTNAGLGINYKISKSFILFLEGQVSTIPSIPRNSATHLSGVSVMIGIKAPL